MGAWTVCRFKGRVLWQERGGGILEGGWYPNAQYELSQNHLTHVLIQPSVTASIDVLVGNKLNYFKTMC